MSFVFSIGYQLRDLPNALARLSEAGVSVVVDVRDTAWSRKPGFSRTRLEKALADAGIGYVHARYAGNPKAVRRSATSHEDTLRRFDAHLVANPEVAEAFGDELDRLLNLGERPCLLCYERHPDDCHRSILLRWWRAAGGEADVVHLDPDGAPRFITGRIASAAEAAASAGTTGR